MSTWTISPDQFLKNSNAQAWAVSPQDFLGGSASKPPDLPTGLRKPTGFKAGDELPEDEPEDFKVGAAYWDTPDQSARAAEYNRQLDAWRSVSSADHHVAPAPTPQRVPGMESLGGIAPRAPKPPLPSGLSSPGPVDQPVHAQAPAQYPNAQILADEPPPPPKRPVIVSSKRIPASRVLLPVDDRADWQRWMQSPLLTPEDVDTYFPFLVGPFRLHAGLMKSGAQMTSPENAAILAGGGGLGAAAEAATGATAAGLHTISAGLSAYFGTQAGKALLEKYPALKQRVATGDWQGALELGGGALADAAMVYASGSHAAHEAGAAGEAAGSAINIHNARATDLVEQDRQAGLQTPGPERQALKSIPMNRAERRAQAQVPSEGAAESVARAQGERQAIIGKPPEQWTNSEVVAADELRAEGYTGAQQELSAPGPIDRGVSAGHAPSSRDQLQSAGPVGPQVIQVKTAHRGRPRGKATNAADNIPPVAPAVAGPDVTAAEPTVPESPATIQMQLQQLHKGQRQVVMFPKGTPMPELPPGMPTHQDSVGNTYIYDPERIQPGQIDAAVATNRLPEILGDAATGMGAPDKSLLQGQPVAVVGRSMDGTTVQSTATDQANLQATIAATKKVTPPGGTISVEPAAVEVNNRLQATPAPPPAPTPAPAPPASEPEPAQDPSGEYFRGAWNLDLNAQGRAQAAADAQATAGQFDEIHAGTLNRHQQMAANFAATNPQAGPVKTTTALEPWTLGNHEGNAVTPERVADINDHAANRPDEPLGGTGQHSGKAGESFNQFKNPLIDHVKGQVERWQPGQKILNVTSGRDVQAVRAWVAAGMPPDRAVDPGVMAAHWQTEPGQMMRLDPQTGGVEDVTAADKDGIYFARHGQTDANEGANGTPPVAAAPWTISPEGFLSAAESGTIGADAAGSARRSGEGEGTAVPQPRRPVGPVAPGAPTVIRVPGEARYYDATYTVRELSDVHSSHNPFNFQENPDYYFQNDRDYSNPTNQERVVLNSQPGRFDPAYLVNDSPDAVNGAPVIDSDGNVLGGNNRTMILSRAYENNPVGARAYQDALIHDAGRFGLNPGDIAAMKRPILVREIAPDDLANPQRAITDLNKTGTAALTPAERATADARTLSPDAAAYLSSVVESEGGDATLNDVLIGKRGPAIINHLVDDGVFTPQEKPSLVDSKTGAVTSAAKERISKMLLGQIFRDSDQMMRTPAEIRNKLERVVSPLLQAGQKPGFELIPSVREAVDLIEYARVHGIRNLSDATAQESIFGDAPQFSDTAQALADFIRNNKPTEVARAFKRYLANTAPTMFGESSPAEAFSDAFAAAEQLGSKGPGRFGERGAVPGDLLTGPVRAADRALGISATVERRIVPAGRKLAAAWDFLGRTFNPAGRGPLAEETAGAMREGTAHMARVIGQVNSALKDIRNIFEGIAPEQRTAFIDRMEAKEAQPTDPIEYRNGVLQNLRLRRPSQTSFGDIANRFAQVNQFLRNEVDISDPETARQWREAYWPNMWKETARARDYFGQDQPSGQGKTNLRGSRSFTKVKEFPTQAEGRAAGLTPLYSNPLDYWQAKSREMAKFAMAKRLEADLKGNRVFVPFGENPPDGYGYIEDPMSTVFGSPYVTVKEAYDKQAMDRLDALADSLGIEHDRRPDIGGSRWGYADPNTGNVTTRFGGPESVLAHEIGHQLQWKYNLLDVLRGKPSTSVELRALADLRFEGEDATPSFRKYVRSADEKAAAVVQALIFAPDRFREVAPETWDILRDEIYSHPELRPLFDIKPSMVLGSASSQVSVGGAVIRGKWAYPDEAAQIVNNYLAPGLRQKLPLFNELANLGNLMLRWKLTGFYHFATTGLNAAYSKLALAERYIMDGNFVEAGKLAAQAPAAFVADAFKGGNLRRQFLDINGTQSELGRQFQALEAGGFRAGMDPWYQTNFRRRMVDSFRAGERLGVLPEAVGAVAESVTAPILETYVPNLKMAAAVDLAKYELGKLGDKPTPAQVRAVMGQAVDSVDNRFGQLTYDNLFWKRVAKDVAMVSVLSLGWNLGTVRELGGGVKDILGNLKGIADGDGPGLSNRIAYLIAMNTIHMMGSAVYQYLATGNRPESVKDLFFPRNGETDERGYPSRVAFPDYAKDEWAWMHQPGTTLVNKLHPFPSELARVFITNKDYWGGEIRHVDDNWIEQLKQAALYAGKELQPLSVGNISKEYERTSSVRRAALTQVGVNPAPTYLNKTPANELTERYQSANMKQGARTAVEVEHSQARTQIIRAIRMNQNPADVIESAIARGRIQRAEVPVLRRAAQQTPLQRNIQSLTPEQALNVFEVATPAERQQISRLVNRKITGSAAKPWDWTPASRAKATRLFGITPSAVPGLSAPGPVEVSR